MEYCYRVLLNKKRPTRRGWDEYILIEFKNGLPFGLFWGQADIAKDNLIIFLSS